MGKKKALVVIELVDESTAEPNKKIADDILTWLREDATGMPWVKNVVGVTVEEE